MAARYCPDSSRGSKYRCRFPGLGKALLHRFEGKLVMGFHVGKLIEQCLVLGVRLELRRFPIKPAAVFLDSNRQVEHFVCIKSVDHYFLLFLERSPGVNRIPTVSRYGLGLFPVGTFNDCFETSPKSLQESTHWGKQGDRRANRPHKLGIRREIFRHRLAAMPEPGD